MELLMWLEQVQIWRLQRKEHEAMTNDKITGSPKSPSTYNDAEVLRMYQRATDETRRILQSSPEMAQIWHQSTPESYRNEMLTRVNDDARHGKRR
jgi:hypothetical protein